MVLYRKYRPQRFADLIGQKHIKEMLLSALSSGRISHGYLFAGPKGTGKTSTARILAKAVNCKVYSSTNSELKTALREQRFGEPCNKCTSCVAIADGSSLDVVEIDAASNRGIDDVRDLREKIKLSPISGRFKIYIIDEAHMLTTEAFNALLKTLEEPPAHVIFVLCTTKADKIPSTVISRLSRFNFNRASRDEIVDAVQKVASSEKIKIDREALSEIAAVSDGSFRDALSILDQLATKVGKITKEDIGNLARAPKETQLYEFVWALSARDLARALSLIEENLAKDGDFSAFCQQVVLFLEEVLLFKIGVGEVADERIAAISAAISFSDLQNLMKLFLLAEGEVESYPLPHIPLVLAACKYCEDAIEEQVKLIDKKKHKAVGGKVKSMAQIETLWGEFLSRMKPVNAHLVAILRSTKPLEFDGELLTLAVYWRFHKDKLEEPKILAIVEKVLSEVLGQKIHLKVDLASRLDRPPEVVSKSDVVEVENSDLASIASEIFSK